jgi:O-antigen/teichoic acid export membrane protein
MEQLNNFMHQLSKLFLINISGKVFTLILFAVLARIITPIHLAYIALIPALSPVLLSLFGFGINTLMERDVPQKLSKNPAAAYQLMRTGYLFNLFTIAVVLVFGSIFVEYWSPLILADYDIVNTRWILLPIASYMLLQITGLFFLVDGKAAQFGFLRVFSDIMAKTIVVVLYLIEPSEMAIFIGLSIGQLPFLIYGLILQRSWMLNKGYTPFRVVFIQALPFYLESNFNTARNQGDNILVSTILGPVALAGYYVAKTVANQLSVFYNPVSNFMTHRLSSQKGHSQEAMNDAFKQVWHLCVPAFVFLACAVGAISPFLIQMVAGDKYTFVWPVAFILCLLSCSLTLYSLSSRILLIIGSAFERFRVTMLQTIFIATFSFILAPMLKSEGIALSWLLALLCSLYIVKIRAIHLKFSWPNLHLFTRSMIPTYLMPVIPLFLFSNEVNIFYIITSFILMACVSLWSILKGQNSYEESQMANILPGRLVPGYQWLRNV